MKDERGQVLILVLGMALVVFAVTGLAVDGTRAFLLRRTLQNAADASALAAANEIDVEGIYSGAEGKLRLSPERARSVAEQWLNARGLVARSEVQAGPDSVMVTLRADLRTTFLSLVGVTAVPVAAQAVAEPYQSEP